MILPMTKTVARVRIEQRAISLLDDPYFYNLGKAASERGGGWWCATVVAEILKVPGIVERPWYPDKWPHDFYVELTERRGFPVMPLESDARAGMVVAVFNGEYAVHYAILIDDYGTIVHANGPEWTMNELEYEGKDNADRELAFVQMDRIPIDPDTGLVDWPYRLVEFIDVLHGLEE